MKGFDDLISDIDRLVDWQLHGGEDMAEWRASNMHPLTKGGSCACPACKRGKGPPGDQHPAGHTDSFSTDSSRWTISRIDDSGVIRICRGQAVRVDMDTQQAIQEGARVSVDVGPGTYSHIELNDGTIVPFGGGPVTVMDRGGQIYINFNFLRGPHNCNEHLPHTHV